MDRLLINHLSFSYNHSEYVLNDISFKVAQGDALAILGSSGSGKSTLLKLIIGLIKGEGEILFNGLDANMIPLKNKNISYVSQNFSMYPNYNVYNNIALPLKASKINFEEIDKRVNEIAKLLDIDYLLTRKEKDLSYGQKQKVAIAKALVKHADLYLFDEPFANLDLAFKTKLREILNDYRHKYHATFIFVSHDYNDALKLADYLMILDNTKIIQEGRPIDVYQNPKNENVEKLLLGSEINEIL